MEFPSKNEVCKSSDQINTGGEKKVITQASISSSEDVNASRKRGRPKLERRGGRKVGALKYPLRTATKRYLAKRKDEVKQSTWDNENRILQHIVSELEILESQNKLHTSNPWKMGKTEVIAILNYFKSEEKDLENETIEKYVRFLEGVLQECGNNVIVDLRRENKKLFPRRARKPISHLSQNEVDAIKQVADGMEGWKGTVMRFIVSFYPATGLRPSELRLALLDDLNLKVWTFKVRHPKGEGSWGQKRIITIMPPGRDATMQFLKERQEYLKSKGFENSKYLIPNLWRGQDEVYSSNYFRKMKAELQEESGISFKLKTFRATFASLTVERNPNLLPDVQKQLGHSSPDTTQRFYADINAADAGKRLVDAWTDKKMCSSVGNDDANYDVHAQESKKSIKPLKGGIGYLPGYG